MAESALELIPLPSPCRAHPSRGSPTGKGVEACAITKIQPPLSSDDWTSHEKTGAYVWRLLRPRIIRELLMARQRSIPMGTAGAANCRIQRRYITSSSGSSGNTTETEDEEDDNDDPSSAAVTQWTKNLCGASAYNLDINHS